MYNLTKYQEGFTGKAHQHLLTIQVKTMIVEETDFCDAKYNRYLIS